MATQLDSVLGCGAQSMLSAGTSYTTLELKVNYLQPITAKMGIVYTEGKSFTLEDVSLPPRAA
jgi:acyl-coenzyme A thioesterase PaaI-like protein